MDWTNGTEFLDLGLCSGLDEDKHGLFPQRDGQRWDIANLREAFHFYPNKSYYNPQTSYCVGSWKCFSHNSMKDSHFHWLRNQLQRAFGSPQLLKPLFQTPQRAKWCEGQQTWEALCKAHVVHHSSVTNKTKTRAWGPVPFRHQPHICTVEMHTFVYTVHMHMHGHVFTLPGHPVSRLTRENRESMSGAMLSLSRVFSGQQMRLFLGNSRIHSFFQGEELGVLCKKGQISHGSLSGWGRKRKVAWPGGHHDSCWLLQPKQLNFFWAIDSLWIINSLPKCTLGYSSSMVLFSTLTPQK